MALDPSREYPKWQERMDNIVIIALCVVASVFFIAAVRFIINAG